MAEKRMTLTFLLEWGSVDLGKYTHADLATGINEGLPKEWFQEGAEPRILSMEWGQTDSDLVNAAQAILQNIHDSDSGIEPNDDGQVSAMLDVAAIAALTKAMPPTIHHPDKVRIPKEVIIAEDEYGDHHSSMRALLSCPTCPDAEVFVGDMVPRVWRSIALDRENKVLTLFGEESCYDGCSGTEIECSGCGEYLKLPAG
jgi:hypothetical protein